MDFDCPFLYQENLGCVLLFFFFPISINFSMHILLYGFTMH